MKRISSSVSGGLIIVILFSCCQVLSAQPISGVWKGKMGNSKIELKLVRKGDSLIGTSYYYDSKTSYRRFSVKGYFDDKNNDVIWWDDSLIDAPGMHRFIGTGPQPLLAVADFNCPGEGIMKLDGKSSLKNDEPGNKRELHLVKGNNETLFPDEWDFLIENYSYGVSHPDLVDSIENYAFQKPTANGQRPTANEPMPTTNGQRSTANEPMPTANGQRPTANEPLPTNQERFASRKKILQQVIPITGDSLELRFYDNAEIDGDSIAVFLNGNLLKEHILLAADAYVMKIAITQLQADNELVMVAENLGSIPPNTSLMVAIINDKRYEAHLESTEGSSALVRLVKPGL